MVRNPNSSFLPHFFTRFGFRTPLFRRQLSVLTTGSVSEPGRILSSVLADGQPSAPVSGHFLSGLPATDMAVIVTHSRIIFYFTQNTRAV